MIYTVTLNPSLDYVMELDNLQSGGLNRSRRETLCAGGKGINVATVLTRLSIPATALGFVAGDTGDTLIRMLEQEGIATDFICLPTGRTRINVKLRADTETEINGRGPAVDANSLAAFFRQLDQLRADDWLVLAGSIPAGVNATLYGDILRCLQGRGTRAVVDAAGDLLRHTLPCHPFLVKPNRAELSELAGAPLATDSEVEIAARTLQAQGAQNVLVSLGGDGALLVDAGGTVHRTNAPIGQVRYTVGAGDSMVAGFLAGYTPTGNYAEGLRMGIAAGSATAFSEGLADKETVEHIKNALLK